MRLLGKRLFAARHALEGRLERPVQLQEIAADIRKRMGSKKAPADSVVSRWLAGKQLPRDIYVWYAISGALGARPGELVFGEMGDAGKGAVARNRLVNYTNKGER